MYLGLQLYTASPGLLEHVVPKSTSKNGASDASDAMIISTI